MYHGMGSTELFVYSERYINDGSPSGFHALPDGIYSPLSDQEYVQVPVFGIPLTETISSGLEFCRTASGISTDLVPFPVHPILDIETAQLGAQYGKPIYLEAIPTSSGRTLFVPGLLPYFVKLHYPSKIGRFERSIPGYKLMAAKEMAILLSGIESSDHQFRILRDRSHIYHQQLPSFGAIFREAPGSIVNPDAGIICLPLFSLFSMDRRKYFEKPLISLLLRDMALSCNEFVDIFIKPLIGSYLYLALEVGLPPECNAQNVLVEVNLASRSVCFLFRDMESFWKDIPIRERKGLHVDVSPYHTIENDSLDRFERRSFLFDFKLGMYCLDPMISAACQFYSVGKTAFIEAAQAISKEYLVDGNYFKDGFIYGYPKSDDVSRRSYMRLAVCEYR